MRIRARRAMACRSFSILGLASAMVGPAGATTLRIVTYNISGDTTTFDNNGVPPSGPLSTVMQALGAESLAGDAQPIDVLGLEELNNTPSVTEQPIVNALNAIYGAGTYAYSTQVDLSDSTSSGSGPSGLIYNTKTVQIVSSTALGTVSGSGAARQPLRFLIQPIGYGSNADFYMYVDHAKAQKGTSEAARRTIEADEVRSDADSLPANSHIIFTGDWNLAGSTNGTTTSGSAEGAYQDLTAVPGATLASGAKAGSEQANDPIATSFQAGSTSASNIKLYTESATDLTARFDLQLDSPAVVPANNQPGLQLVPDTYTSFGNSYYVGNTLSTNLALGGEVTDPANTNTMNPMNEPLSDLSNRSAVLTALTQLTDHLPVVADYNIVGVNPSPTIWNGGTGNWSTAADWSTAAVPNSSTTEVQIDNGNAIASVVTLDQSETVEDVTLDTNDTLKVSSGNTLTIAGPNISVLTGTLNNSGTLVISGGTTQVLANATQGGNFTVSNGASLQLTSTVGLGSLTDNGTTTITASSQTITSLNGSGALKLNGTSLMISNGGSFSGAISDTSSGAKLTLLGGTLVLSGTNTYGSGTYISSGTLNFAALNNLGTGAINFGGGTLQYATGNTADISGRTVSFNSGGGTIDTNGNATVIYANAIGNSGTGGLTKAGLGKLVLNGATYTGTTTVTTGTLELAGGSLAGTSVNVGSGTVLTVDSGAALSTSTALSDGGTTNLNNASQTIATLNGAGLLNLSGTVLNITSGGTFSGTVGGTGTLGIGGGTLEIASGGAITTASVSISPAATLTVDSGATTSSSIALTDGGVVDFTNASPTVGALNGGGTVNLVSTPLTVSNGGAFSGVIADTGGAGLTVSGGTLVLSGPNTFSGNTHVTSGTLTLASTGSIASPAILVDAGSAANINGAVNASLAITANGSLTFGFADINNDPTSGILAQTVGSLTIGPTGKVAVAPAASSTTRTALVVTSTFSNAGTLDLANNDMIVKGGNAATITQQVLGGAITSSTAAALPNPITTLAVVSNNEGVFSTFDNQSVSSGDVLVKYTFYGDADLSGRVDASDYLLIDTGFNSQSGSSPLSGWYNGDFNLDGEINGDDYTLIDNAYNTQGSVSYAGRSVGPTEIIATATQQIAAVPEPGSISLLGLAAMGLIKRRRRRK